MEGRGGCCVTRYATGAYDVSKLETLMRKFRPIAPKPLAGGAVSYGSSSESGDALSRSGGGAKRKCAKDSKGSDRCNRRRRKTAPPPSPVTLPLLPETPDPKDPPAEESAAKSNSAPAPAWLSFENRGRKSTPSKRFDLTAGGSVVETVEGVTDTWREDMERLGSTDEETVRVKLSEDTCPGFISDGYGRVTWTNGAFNGMVVGGGVGGVWLETKVVGVPYGGGFTCSVRVQREKSTDLTVPCDVWRIMDGGGFAWRLDVKAALTLSLAL